MEIGGLIVNWEYLVSLAISGIHDYIFGTNKLRESRGASILLDRLNCKIPVEELQTGKYGKEDKDWRCIVAGGGNIKILFANQTKAEEYAASISRKFREMASGARFTIIISKRDGESEGKWIKKAERELQREKELPKKQSQIPTSSFFKACQACGLFPAEMEDIRPEGVRHICKSCHEKVNESERYREAVIYKRLIDKIDFFEPKFPSDFSEMGEESDPKGYLGFVYADANRMGEHLAGITTFDELKNFSKDVEEATLDAAVTAIANHFKDKFLPVQIILSGGDDLILALPAHKAIDVAMDFCMEFNKRMGSYPITTSASVVICHDTLPIRNILDAAESLLKNAKAKSRQKGGGSYMDFIVVTGSALEDQISKRKKELEYRDRGTHTITKRPYSLEEMAELIKAIQEVKKVNFPTGKLKMLYASLFKGHNQSIMDACYLKIRLEDRHEKIMNELIAQFRLTKFPWEERDINQYVTPFADIVELYKFIHPGD